MITFESGKIYKVKHQTLTIGRMYGSGTNQFQVLDNCIIFSPKVNISFEREVKNLPCSFLITFDKLLCLDGATGYGYDCKVEKVTQEDIEEVVTIFKNNGKLNELSSLLKKSGYRYNRKLEKVVTI